MKTKITAMIALVLGYVFAASAQWICDVDNLTLKNEEGGWEFTIKIVDSAKRTFEIADEGWVSGSGVLDLSAEIQDADGAKWDCVKLGDKFLENSSEGVNGVAAVTSVTLPKTATKFGDGFLNLSYVKNDVLTDLVFECPNVTGPLGDYLVVRRTSKLSRIVFKCPQVTSMSAGTFQLINKGNSSDRSKLADTDFDEWDMSGITDLLPTLNKTSAFSGSEATGTLRLPVIQTIATNFFYSMSKLEAIELGTNGCTVTSIGTDAFSGDCGATKLTIGGSANGYTIAENAFTLKNLREAIFLSEVAPTVSEAEGREGIFGKTDAAALTCCFRVPMSDDWKNFFGTLTPASEAEKQTFANNIGNLPLGYLYVIEPNEKLGTQNRQFVACLPVAVSYDLSSTDLSDANGSLSVIDSLGNEVLSGTKVSPGTELTFTATVNEGMAFSHWDGVPYELKYTNPLTLTVGYEPLAISMRTHRIWIYDGNGHINNGTWELNVIALGDNNDELMIGSSANGYKGYSAYTGTGKGVLDLSAPVKDANGNDFIINNFRYRCFSVDSTTTTKYFPISMLIMPRTVTTFGKEICMIEEGVSLTDDSLNLTNIVLDIPEFNGMLPDNSFYGHKDLQTLSINAPNMLAIGANVFGSCASGADNPFSDLSKWNLSSLTNLKANAFNLGNNNHIAEWTGTLALPNIQVIEGAAFNNVGMTELELGFGYEPKDGKKLTLTYAASPRCDSLGKVTFGGYAAIEVKVKSDGSISPIFRVSETVKYPALTNIVFLGKPPSSKIELAHIVMSKSESNLFPTRSKNQLIVRGSRSLGWDRIEGLRQPTDDEDEYRKYVEPLLSEKECILGIFDSDDEGFGIAWVVHSPSPYDPKGTILIIR